MANGRRGKASRSSARGTGGRATRGAGPAGDAAIRARVERAAGSLAIEGMVLTAGEKRLLLRLGRGELTEDEYIRIVLEDARLDRRR